MTQNKAKIRKAISITLTVLAVLIFACAVFVFALTAYAKSNGKQAVLFGYSFSVVMTDSMTPEIQVGELVTVKNCPIESVEIGENAVYIAQSGALKGQRIIHKVEEKDVDGEGKTFIRTRGVKEGAPLDAPVYAEAFVGIGVSHSVFLGKIVVFFSNTVNWVCLLVFLFGVWLGVRQIKKLIFYAKNGDSEGEKTAEKAVILTPENTPETAEKVDVSLKNEENSPKKH